LWKEFDEAGFQGSQILAALAAAAFAFGVVDDTLVAARGLVAGGLLARGAGCLQFGLACCGCVAAALSFGDQTCEDLIVEVEVEGSAKRVGRDESGAAQEHSDD
jgi:hypothetical protein